MALVDIALDLQIAICTFLHPCDILTLRQTCKAFQLVTRQRIVWIEVLHQVCLENKLFLPSFPIPDMSNAELERAAISPRRWIELCNSYVIKAIAASGDNFPKLSPTTRIVDNPLSKIVQGWNRAEVVLVPGGRYMVGCCELGGLLGVWDLGYSSSADCKLIASVESWGEFGGIQATSDGMGLVILTLQPREYSWLFEIYPQSESPQLTQIADLNYQYHRGAPEYLSPSKVIWHIFHQPKTIVRVWDYRLNASVSFTTPVDAEVVDDVSEVCATETAIILLYEQEILIWAIPTLSPQPPNFNDNNPTRLPPQIRVKFPHDLGLQHKPPLYGWRMISSWYVDSSRPLYFDKLYPTVAKLDRLKFIIKPDLSDATLHFINTLPLDEDIYLENDYPYVSPSVVCEDTLVSCWNTSEECGIYPGSILSRPTTPWHGDAKITLPTDRSYASAGPVCPASGRFVYVCEAQQIVVLDFLAH